MDDLVEWLRRMALGWKGAANYYTEAADEIERLRARVAELEAKYCPGHTDMMVTPEQLDDWLEANPPPDEFFTEAPTPVCPECKDQGGGYARGCGTCGRELPKQSDIQTGGEP